MNQPRLDRLTALIGGAAPRVAIRLAGPLAGPLDLGAEEPRLELALLVRGELAVAGDEAQRRLVAPTVAALATPGRKLRFLGRGAPPEVLVAELRFDGPAANPLLDAFRTPVFLDLRAADGELDPLLALIALELERARCGREALLNRVGEILLIALLRHIIATPGRGSGILAALADPRIALAVVAMHERPEAGWSLERLAERAGMSRTAFATTFRERLGTTPGAYLAELRLAIAEREVERGQGLKRAARAAGYASTAALSRALSRRRAAAAVTSPP